jgi:hypothetical protein
MGIWDINMRHIVDVDGQLLAIDAEVIDAFSLLEKANRPTDRQLWLVHAGERFLVEPEQWLRLSEDEVLFFETTPAEQRPPLHRLAA